MSANRPTAPPNYVRCFCQQCGQPIEFDGSQFEERELRAITCPHCGKETGLIVAELNLEAPLSAPLSPSIPMNYRHLVIAFVTGMALGTLLAFLLSHRYIIEAQTGQNSPVLRMDRLTGKTWSWESTREGHYRWRGFDPDI
jgi:DNA-directed RNA polymerase subunit RPC12/RpoP